MDKEKIKNHFNQYNEAYVKTHPGVIQACLTPNPDDLLTYLGSLLELNESDFLIDCGSGVGKPAHFFSKHFKCLTLGLNISDVQLDHARHYQTETCGFVELDFEKIKELELTPTKLCFLESFCYAQNPQQLLKDCFDVLAGGGSLLIKDFVPRYTRYSTEHWQRVYEFYHAKFHKLHDILAWAFDAGFLVDQVSTIKIPNQPDVTFEFFKEIGLQNDPILTNPRINNTFSPTVILLKKEFSL